MPALYGKMAVHARHKVQVNGQPIRFTLEDTMKHDPYRKTANDSKQQRWEHDVRQYYHAKGVADKASKRLEDYKQKLENYSQKLVSLRSNASALDNTATPLHEWVDKQRCFWQEAVVACQKHLEFWTNIMKEVADRYPKVKW